MLLAVVAVLYVAVQLALVPMDRFFEWDEAVYVSQVSEVAPPSYFGAHRARGISALVWPVASLTGDITTLRVYLAILSGAALFLAYRPWLKVAHPVVAPLGALVFSTSWLTLFYGSEVSPNLYVAFGSVAAAGFAAQVLWGQATRRSPVAVALAVALVALMRPSDSVWLALPLLVAAVATRRRGRPVLLAVAAGGVLGWLPWVAESFVRFGGPIERLRTASAAARVDALPLLDLLQLHLRLTDGGMSCCFGRFRQPFIPAEGLLWWLGLVGFCLVGVFAGRGAIRWAAALASGAAVSLGATYLLLTSFVYPRFLLPAYALAAVGAAAGGAVAVRGPHGRAWGTAGVAIATAASLGLSLIGAWHVGVLRETVVGDALNRNVAVEIAGRVRPKGIVPPCFVVGARAPSIAFALGCRAPGINRKAQMRNEEALRARLAEGDKVAAFWRFEPPPGSFAPRWREKRLGAVPQPGWRMYRPPAVLLRAAKQRSDAAAGPR